jgi:CRISPR-associated protein Cas6
MFWKEEIDEEHFVVPDRVLDLIFKIRCPTLPIDHAWALSEAINAILPWFAEEPYAGLHLIYGADSQNGWQRPTDREACLYLSRRTRLILRLPKSKIEQALHLSGHCFDIAGHTMKIAEGHTRTLSATTTLYSRQVVTPEKLTEEAFLASSVAQLKTYHLNFKKVLCGKETSFMTPDGPLWTQSLMVAGLPLNDAITLQEKGLGPYRSRGFGLFVPHKTV